VNPSLDASELKSRRLSAQIGQFEGLIYTTSRRVVDAGVEMDLDDVRQFLRLKVWYVIERYEAARGVPLDQFVFGCLWNAKLDLLKRPRRYTESIDELRDGPATAGLGARDTFDARYLSTTDEEEIFGGQAAEILLSDLSTTERRVVELRSSGLTMNEIERELSLAPGQGQAVMRGVRKTLAHLRPDTAEQRTGPMRPLPQVERQAAPLPAVLAA
jgi:DNA-directed RNA polymerase specialized sigma24 family protein